MTTCMGGWCHLRDKCKNHAPHPHRVVVERLCEAGVFDAFEPLRSGAVDNPLYLRRNLEIVADTTDWLFPTASPAGTPHDALSPAGVPPLPSKSGEMESVTA